MALTFSNFAGNTSIEDSIPIARDGQRVIRYIKTPLDLLADCDPEQALDLVSNMVNTVTDSLQLHNIGTKKLNDLDYDILANSAPTDRLRLKIYNIVKSELSAREAKTYHSPSGGIQIIPRNIRGQRDSLYVSAPSGAGKSFFTAKFGHQYNDQYPSNTIYLFSMKNHDDVFDGDGTLITPGLKNLVRVPFDRSFVQKINGSTNDEGLVIPYANSLVIFDDFERISDLPTKEAIMHLKNSIFQLGRSHNITITSIQHKTLGGKQSITDLSEATHLVCYPEANLSECRKLLKSYVCGNDKALMDRILDEDTKKERWLAIIRPRIFITAHTIRIIE